MAQIDHNLSYILHMSLTVQSPAFCFHLNSHPLSWDGSNLTQSWRGLPSPPCAFHQTQQKWPLFPCLLSTPNCNPVVPVGNWWEREADSSVSSDPWAWNRSIPCWCLLLAQPLPLHLPPTSLVSLKWLLSDSTKGCSPLLKPPTKLLRILSHHWAHILSHHPGDLTCPPSLQNAWYVSLSLACPISLPYDCTWLCAFLSVGEGKMGETIVLYSKA